MKLKSTPSVLSGDILVPASKSHTIRAVAFAAVAHGTSVIRNPLMSDDARSALSGAIEMGAAVTMGDDWIIRGTGGRLSENCRHIDVGNSGTSLRILTALCALADHPVSFDGDKSIRQRPMQPLLSALQSLGARTIESAGGKCPFTILGPINGGRTTVNGVSSQFLTALLITCPLAPQDTEIIVENLNERPYVEITLDWLRRMGIAFENKGLDWFRIKGNQEYSAFDRNVPADFSTATFPLCAAAVTGSTLTIKGLDFADHQGDKAVFEYFEKMGMDIRKMDTGVKVSGRRLKGIDIDMNATPDALPAMAVAGCFAEGTTRLLNVPQARLKECDRIAAMAKELSKMGADIEELPDGLIIKQSKLTGTAVHGYDDHRLVMSLSIAGLAASGQTIVDTAESASVTYPAFVDDMKRLGASFEVF
ncbi:MAG TPA: 3-phosphoshikimate 1-carboxyvinyltransferase [Bacteroidales bacterium]|nr:3-phosphoshikimate 1-carboxyvinyltransferase [Bacteroidales bacterium]